MVCYTAIDSWYSEFQNPWWENRAFQSVRGTLDGKTSKEVYLPRQEAAAESSLEKLHSPCQFPCLDPLSSPANCKLGNAPKLLFSPFLRPAQVWGLLRSLGVSCCCVLVFASEWVHPFSPWLRRPDCRIQSTTLPNSSQPPSAFTFAIPTSVPTAHCNLQPSPSLITSVK